MEHQKFCSCLTSRLLPKIETVEIKGMINVRPLCKALAIKASKELNEVPARVPEDIETLREWLLTQKHLKTPLGE